MLRRLLRRLAEVERHAVRRRKARAWTEKWQQMRAAATTAGDGRVEVAALARQFTGEAFGTLIDLAGQAASEWVRIAAVRELFARAGPA